MTTYKRGRLYHIVFADHFEDGNQDGILLLNVTGRYIGKSNGCIVLENWWSSDKNDVKAGTTTYAHVIEKAIMSASELRET